MIVGASSTIGVVNYGFPHMSPFLIVDVEDFEISLIIFCLTPIIIIVLPKESDIVLSYILLLKRAVSSQ